MNNKQARLAAQAKHYANNKDIYQTRKNMKRKNKKEYINNIKMELGCQVCGYSRCSKGLVLHHVDESKKTDHPTKMAQNGWAFKRIDKELENCMVLCQNCHCEHHQGVINANTQRIFISEYKTYQTWNKNKEYPKEYIREQINRPCSSTGRA